jgi:tetratricopeptide (TPR) repeat protein
LICFLGAAGAQAQTSVSSTNPQKQVPLMSTKTSATAKSIAKSAAAVAPSAADKQAVAKYMQYARNSFTRKQYQQCLSYVNKAISCNPADTTALELRGSALYQLEQFNEAVEDLNRCEKLSHGTLTAQGYEDRAQCYAQLHEPQKVVDDYTKAIGVNPKLDWLYSQRAAAFSDIQQFDKAIKDVNKAISIKPQTYMYENRADYYSREGKYQKAIDDYNTAMKLAPDIPLHYTSRAKLYEKLGKQELARKDRAKADEIIRRDMDP